MLRTARYFSTLYLTGKAPRFIEVRIEESTSQKVDVKVGMIGPTGNKMLLPAHQVKNALALGLSVRRMR